MPVWRPRLPVALRRLAAWFTAGALLGGLGAQTPPITLLSDLTPPLARDSDPTAGVELGGRLVFFATTPTPMVCVTDGTAAGTQAVASAGAGPVTRFARVGSRVVFGSGTTLWATDGTVAGTQQIADVEVMTFPGAWHGGREIVFAGRSQGDDELWVTDGTALGTALLADLDASGSSEPRHLTAFAWRTGLQTRYLTFFTAAQSRTGRELWVTEGSAATTQIVDDLVPGTGSSFSLTPLPVPVSISMYGQPNDLFVAANARTAAAGTEVFRWRRTVASTSYVPLPLTEIALGVESADAAWLTTRGDEVICAAQNPARGRELWRVNYATGANALLDIAVGPGSSSPADLTPVPSPTGQPLPAIACTAVDATFGRQVWLFDGAAPQRVSERGSEPRFVAAADGAIWFTALDSQFGRELWLTEGALASTRLTVDLLPGPQSSDPSPCGVLSVGGAATLVFGALPGGVSGRELHTVRRTTSPSLLVDLTPPQAVSSNPSRFVTLADHRAVLRTLAEGRETLWITNPTATNISLLWQAPNSDYQLWGNPLALDDGTFLFGVAQRVNNFPILNYQVWRSDGTPNGTAYASYVAQGYLPTSGDFIEYGASVYFTLFDSQIYRTDRLGHNPTFVYGRVPFFYPLATVTNLRRVGDRLFFSGVPLDGNDGPELHVWQPPAAPAKIDIAVGPQGSNPRRLTAFRNRCYFVANDGVHGDELWSSNGVGSGTTMVLDANPGAGHGVEAGLLDVRPLVGTGTALFYSGHDGVNGWELWRSTGFAAGTAMIADFHPSGSSNPREITAVHVGTVACAADDGAHGRELWRVDTLGARNLFDLRPGLLGSDPTGLTWTTRHLLFAADDGIHGREPWHGSWIDLSPVSMLADLATGADSSNPALIQQAGTKFLLAADPRDGLTGREVFAIDCDAASVARGRSCHPPDRIMSLASTAPVLGRGLTYWVFDPGSNVPALVRLSLPGGPVSLPIIPCPLWLDLASTVPVDDFVTTGSFTRTIPVPAFGSLYGAHLRLQCIFYYPPHLLATNALDLLFGN